MTEIHRFWLAKRAEFYWQNAFDPNHYVAVEIPNELLDLLIPIGQEMHDFLKPNHIVGYDPINREHQLQLLFIILQNIPGNDGKKWIEILAKLHQMGQFHVLYSDKEQLQQIMNKAYLMGRHVTPI